MADDESLDRNRPSASEWDLHKRTIIELYKHGSFKDLQVDMKRRHGFYATKRMYDTRFRKWGVSKNLKSSDKDHLIEVLEHSQGGDPLNDLSPDVSKKLKRHKKALERQELKASTSAPTTQDLADRCKVVPQYHVSAEHGSRTTDALIPDSNAGSSLAETGPIVQYHSQTIDANSERSLEYDSLRASEGVFPSDAPMLWDELSTSSLPFSMESAAIASEQSESSFFAPAPIINLPVFQAQERVLHCVIGYYHSRLERLEGTDTAIDVLSIGTTPESKQFWCSLKNGIYLWKISSPETNFQDVHGRSFAALDTANALAHDALSTEPMNFVCEMLSALSPTRIGMYPPLRSHIFGYLAEQSAIQFPPTHPIRTLCSELQQDLQNSFISRKALSALLDVFSSRLGRRHPSTHKIMTTIVMQLRRSDDFAEVRSARDLAEGTMRLAEIQHGRDSDVTRRAAVELSHVLTRLGEHGQPLKLRMEVVTEPKSRPSLDEAPVWRQDGLAAHTMEDIAEYYVRFGNMSAGIEWLRRAKDIGSRAWGETSFSTLHIADKLEQLEQGSIEGQVVDGYLVSDTVS